MIKAILFLFILLVLFFVIRFSRPSKVIQADYMAAMIDKHARIDRIKCPKIILGGGSNLAFGINSKELEDTFKMPVVNMGLHAGLGLNFILNELKYSIKENDIVFLSIEYFLAKDGVYSLEDKASDFFPLAHNFYHTSYISEIGDVLSDNQDKFKDDILSLKKTILFRKTSIEELEHLRKIDSVEKIVYSRKAFNAYGDVIGHLDQPSRKEGDLNGDVVFDYSYWEGIKEINDFYDYAKSKNVRVFFLFPDIAAFEYKKNEGAIRKLKLDMEKDLKVEILNSPEDLVYPDSCFFDTVYHLNKFGREERTKKMIRLIQNNADALNTIAISKKLCKETTQY
jgi:hypothetical protein